MTGSDRTDQSHLVHRAWREFPVIDRAEGVYLFDTQGRRYLDGAAGSVVVSIGHGIKSVLDAMHAQGKRVSFAPTHAFTNEPSLRLAHMISERAPGLMRGRCRTWLSCTGTDAVDDAARLARQYFLATGKPSKYLIIGRWQSFHGNQLGVAGFSGYTYRRKAYQPMIAHCPHIPPAYCYRCPFELSLPACRLKCARALETEIRQVGAENVAAFIAEPVVGSALGSVPAPAGYFEVIREICDRQDVLLISDEVMTGFGRTGRWFGIEHWNVTPDILATAKGMTSGYTPLAATIARDEIWDAVQNSGRPFMAGHTMNQNPVSCAGTVATIEYIDAHHLVDRAAAMGDYLLRRLEELLRLPIVGDVRGKGLMCGIEFVRNQQTKEPFPPDLRVSYRVQAETMTRGLVLYPCTGCVDGAAGDMLQIAPPFIITSEQIDELVGILQEAIEVVQAEGLPA